MNRANYQKAIRYATKLLGDYNSIYNPFDLVHDAYLKCQDENFLLRAVKLVHYEKLREKYISIGYQGGTNSKKGEIVRKTFTEISPTGSVFGDGSVDIETKDEYKEDELFLGRFDENVLSLKVQGYKNQEIESILNRSNPTITASVKRIKDKLMHTNSPFNGSKLKIVKRIRRKDFEKDKESLLKIYGKEKGDWEVNEFYEQLPCIENTSEGLLIKEKDSD